MHSVFKINQRQRISRPYSASQPSGEPSADNRADSVGDELARREEAQTLLDQLERSDSVSLEDLAQLRTWVKDAGGDALDHIKTFIKDQES